MTTKKTTSNEAEAVVVARAPFSQKIERRMAKEPQAETAIEGSKANKNTCFVSSQLGIVGQRRSNLLL